VSFARRFVGIGAPLVRWHLVAAAEGVIFSSGSVPA
jgi:hypothetical protein